jgi:hypothetical protein
MKKWVKCRDCFYWEYAVMSDSINCYEGVSGCYRDDDDSIEIEKNIMAIDRIVEQTPVPTTREIYDNANRMASFDEFKKWFEENVIS